ncbi:MAG: hydroxymethylbilane synthase [Chloroflexi bacterium]|nr:hydroxymethylbilane synthase [Chloroflexota bacterium]
MKKNLIVGSRTSRLAMWQSNYIIALITRQWPFVECTIRPFVTHGDKTLHVALPKIGGKGLFTQELEHALQQGKIDLAVHSLKDLPVENAAGLILGAMIGRADVRDVLVTREAWSLDDLPTGTVVGTSSLRRQAQLLHHRPDLQVRSIRGNIETRIRKVLEGEYEATVLAAAGLNRLGLDHHIRQELPMDVMLPAPGQGVLAIQCRAGDEDTLSLLHGIHQPEVEAAATAERTFMHALGAGCSTPVAAFAPSPTEHIYLTGLVAAPDGSKILRLEGSGQYPQMVGSKLAARALQQGAKEILSYDPEALG